MRRQDHLSLIDDAHPLKPITLKCLRDNDKDCPTASDLNLSLSKLMATQGYAHSLHQETYDPYSQTCPQQSQEYYDDLDRQHRVYEEELLQQVYVQNVQLEQAKNQLQSLAGQLEQANLRLTSQTKNMEVKKTKLELSDSHECVAQLQKIQKENSELSQSLKQKEMRIKELEESVLLKDKKINDLEITIKTLQTAPKGRGGMGEVEGGQNKDMTALRWEVAETAPVEM